MALTGRYDFRKSMTGRLRLYVEYNANGFWDFLTGKKTYCHQWRAANIMDLAAPELRHLMDLRFTNPPHMPQVHNALQDWPEHRPKGEAASINVLIAPSDGVRR
jgi:hypothetical protein